MTHENTTGAPTPPRDPWAPPGSGWVGQGSTAPLPPAPAQPGHPGQQAPGAFGQHGQHPQQHGQHPQDHQGGYAGQPPQPPAGRSRRGPGWPGVAVAAVLAALVGGGSALAIGSALDDGSGASASATSSGSASPSGSAADVPLGESVDWNTVASTVAPSVVTIQVSDGQTGGEGTGIILDAEGHVLTNNHVAAGAGADAQIRVVLADGRVYQGEITGTDPQTDLAVLQLQDAPDDLTVATFGDSDDVEVGQPVMALGNPLGLSQTVTTGIVSALDRPVTTQASETEQAQPDPFGFGQPQQSAAEPVVTNAIQTDAAINPGNSGGPLVDAAGQVIGINSSIASNSTGSSQAGSIGLGFAIPGSEAQRIATELIEDGAAQHALLGVSLQSGDGTATVGGDVRQAALVAQVTAGSAAAEAGIEQGDAVVAVDGEPVTGAESLTAQVRSRAPGDEVTLTVVRDGDSREVQVTLGTNPSDAQG